MFKYTIHNIIGHPVMEVCYLLGFKELGKWVHDSTLPEGWEEEYSNSWDPGEDETNEL